jgi:hypothetical protein
MGVGPVKPSATWGLAGSPADDSDDRRAFDQGYVLNSFAWVTNCWELYWCRK